MIEAGPSDRVLVVGTPSAEEVRALSLLLERGVCVVMGPEQAIRELRRSCADLENVMLIFDPGDGTIPWQDRFFTLASCDREIPDLRRVLASE